MGYRLFALLAALLLVSVASLLSEQWSEQWVGSQQDPVVVYKVSSRCLPGESFVLPAQPLGELPRGEAALVDPPSSLIPKRACIETAR